MIHYKIRAIKKRGIDAEFIIKFMSPTPKKSKVSLKGRVSENVNNNSYQ